VWWSRDGSRLFFISRSRGDRDARLYALDPATGVTTLLVEERSDTQVQSSPTYPARPNAHGLASGETIWWSERSGWGHLYLYDPDGSVRALTGGDWIVRDLVAVDEQARIALFSAGGRERGLDPYVRQLYRVSLDGGAVERLTDDELDHEATASPSGRFLVDVASWVSVPDSSRVLDASGDTVLELERADVRLLYDAGWQPPERFTVKAADGETDLYGLLYRPHGFHASQRYALVEDIYPGPQINAAGIRFCDSRSGHAASMAALGFAVVVVDGRGTPFRSKAFQEHCRGPRDAEWLEDHVAALRQLAERHPWLDVDHVGIYGHSGGGRASAHAILRHGEVYKVAVSLCGNHDDAVYYPGWSEKYHGFVEETDYRAHANPTYAANLTGKLLLIHGELDNNVNPYLTLRLADALMAANKDFDLLIVPNADHSMLVHQSYWLRRRWDYFVRWLQGVQPPAYELADIPVTREALLERLPALGVAR
jgi:dipeptidyl aminopeptidase/acylaminoacyl peptidase